jgi:hypothetical protein
MVGTREDEVIAAEDVEGSVEEFGEVNLNQLLQGKVYIPIQVLSIYASQDLPVSRCTAFPTIRKISCSTEPWQHWKTP